jgi:serine phosphatase RsbU (regulator of sigma subunit)/anti-sigma regulatory factor (Ser/Thr protein kinase)
VRAAGPSERRATPLDLDISPDDPLVAYFTAEPNAVELDQLDLDSPALRALRAAGIKLAVPLVSQGELVGLLNLGPRMSEQDYSADDRALLDNLALQAGPAVRVAQLVREQQAEVQARERLQQELRVARLIQQTLLPKDLPALPGWHVTAAYRPARAVGGDFYDFIDLPDGRLGLVIADVTDKGVPAALVMATTRATLRSAAQQLSSPGEVLARVNEQLCPEIPPKMFVTCLYAILDPATGRIQFANAGHDLPYRCCRDGEVSELRATGMPLGLMPGMTYDERETVLGPGESLLLYTDGLVEAHNDRREMFSFGRLRSLMATHKNRGSSLIEMLLAELAAFTGPGWEQEDDVSLVTLDRDDVPAPGSEFVRPETVQASERSASGAGRPADEGWQTLAEFSVASRPGNEREALAAVEAALRDCGLPRSSMDRLKTAICEATMNAMEHGNKYQADAPAELRVLAASRAVAVQVTDQGGSEMMSPAEAPDIEAKMAGLQSPRGWGLFLIRNLVDEMHVARDEVHHTVEMIMYLPEEGARNAGEKS